MAIVLFDTKVPQDQPFTDPAALFYLRFYLRTFTAPPALPVPAFRFPEP